MFVSELDSFVQKFKQLWNTGHVAHLDVDTCAGNAWVGLRLQLSHAPEPQHNQVGPPFRPSGKKVESPSRQRRRARRAAAQLEKVKVGARKETEQDSIANDEIVIFEKTDVLETAQETLGKESNVAETTPESSDDAIVDVTDEPTYCKICAEVCEEMETSEDVFYHIMNNHEVDDVLKDYGQEWIQARKYCIRKGSPFEKWKD